MNLCPISFGGHFTDNSLIAYPHLPGKKKKNPKKGETVFNSLLRLSFFVCFFCLVELTDDRKSLVIERFSSDKRYTGDDSIMQGMSSRYCTCDDLIKCR